MVAVPIAEPDTEEVAAIIEEEGTIRLNRLADRFDLKDGNLAWAVMDLVSRGQVSVFQVGDYVQVRHEG